MPRRIAMKSDNCEVLVDIKEGIALITLNRPAARNALTFKMQ